MRTFVALSLAFFTFGTLATLSAPAARAAGKAQLGPGLVVRDPNFYKLLAPNSQMRCPFVRDKNYVIVVSRGDGDEIRVVLEKSGKVEEPTAWTGTIKKEDLSGAQVAHYRRDGQYGFVKELTISRRRSHEAGYGLPALFSEMTELWSKDEKGEDKKDLYLDGSFRLACEAPLPR